MSFARETEQELLQRIARGEEHALRELHRRFARRIYAFALNRLHDEGEAEAIVSDTLYEVWRFPLRFRGESSFSTWLLGISRNKILSALRARRAPYEELDEDMPSQDLGVFEVLAEEEHRRGVRHCPEKLQDLHRECLYLVFYEGLALAQVAQLQQCPENTVKTRLFHARQKIKGCLERLLRDEMA
ncbi:MAG: sigma-70 family RNA polymerase sigma factor [Rhodocyclaceae bacterium]